VTAPTRIAVLMGTARRGGGAERSMISLVKHAPPTLAFTLILPEEGELRHVATAAGAAVRVVPWPRRVMTLGERGGMPNPLRLVAAIPAFVTAAARVAAAIRDVGPDVLITNGIKPHMLGTMAARRVPRLPLIWYLRDSTDGRRLSRAVLRRVSSRCDAAIAISHYIAQEAAAYLPSAVHPAVVYNIVNAPVDIDDEGMSDAPVRKPAGETWFATIGGLTPLKGHDVFLKAAAVVSRARPDARFLVVGSNQYATEQRMDYPGQLRALARELGLDGVVRFLGERQDVPRLLRDIDVVVQSNTAPEAFGRTVAEAMGAGIPVIASRAWSFRELIDEGRTGWLVEPGDVDGLAACMLNAAANPAERHDIGQRARTFITGITAPSTSVAAFHAVVARAIARRAALPGSAAP